MNRYNCFVLLLMLVLLVGCSAFTKKHAGTDIPVVTGDINTDTALASDSLSKQAKENLVRDYYGEQRVYKQPRSNPNSIIPAPGVARQSGYNQTFIECDKIAKQSRTNTANNTAGGAATGAAVGAIVAAMLGADVGTTAGLGALSGGAAGFGGSAAHNASEHKRIMLECMRYRGFKVY